MRLEIKGGKKLLKKKKKTHVEAKKCATKQPVDHWEK